MRSSMPQMDVLPQPALELTRQPVLAAEAARDLLQVVAIAEHNLDGAVHFMLEFRFDGNEQGVGARCRR